MRLFQSEMLQTLERQAPGPYRTPAYGSRYDRRAQRTRVPALTLEPSPAPTRVLTDAPREVLFRMAALDHAA